MRKSIEKENNRSLKAWGRLYHQWLRLFQKFSVYIITPYAVEAVLDPEFRILLSASLSSEKAAKIFEVISSPSTLTEYQKMRLTIGRAVIQKTPSERASKKLAQDFGWYNEYSYVEPLYDERFFLRELRRLTRKKAKAERNATLSKTRNNAALFTKVRRQLQGTTLLLADVLHTYTFLRTDRIDQLKKTQTAVRKIFVVTAKALQERTEKDWMPNMVAYCLNREIEDFLFRGKIPNHEEVLARKNQKYLYYFDHGHSYVTYGKTVTNAQQIIHKGEEAHSEIKGLIAYPGKAQGKVIRVFGKSDLSKVKKGTILVATATLPDYLPAMRKAKAFVTEEGGITSHAAVIARELKKPCIVGTKVATKVLHDGDMVEVDANKGIVRKLS